MDVTKRNGDRQTLKAQQQLLFASMVTCLFGAFQLLYWIVIATVLHHPLPGLAMLHALLFVGLGLLLSQRRWWCLWFVLPLSAVTFVFHLLMLREGASLSLLFLLVLAGAVLASNFKVLGARRVLGRAHAL